MLNLKYLFLHVYQMMHKYTRISDFANKVLGTNRWGRVRDRKGEGEWERERKGEGKWEKEKGRGIVRERGNVLMQQWQTLPHLIHSYPNKENLSSYSDSNGKFNDIHSMWPSSLLTYYIDSVQMCSHISKSLLHTLHYVHKHWKRPLKKD